MKKNRKKGSPTNLRETTHLMGEEGERKVEREGGEGGGRKNNTY